MGATTIGVGSKANIFGYSKEGGSGQKILHMAGGTCHFNIYSPIIYSKCSLLHCNIAYTYHLERGSLLLAGGGGESSVKFCWLSEQK